MNWDLMDKHDVVDAGLSGGDASRNVVLDIDTDIVLENLESMAKALTDEQQSLLSGFSLSKVNTYVTNTVEADKVTFTNGEAGESTGM